MAYRKSAVLDMSVDDQRETVISEHPLARQVTPTTHVAQLGGKTAKVGELDPNRHRGRPTDPKFDAAVEIKHNQARLIGLTPATVLNFLPIPLALNSPMQPLKIVIPAAYGTTEFTSHTWEELWFEPVYMGESGNAPREFHPIELALAYENEARINGFGGVVAYMGDLDDLVNNIDLQERITVAKTAAYAWMQGKVGEGDAEWNSPNHQNARNITSLHRDCAQKLYDLKLMVEMPEWIKTIRKPENIPTSCKDCGATPEHNAAKCVKCGYVIDPAKAFKNGSISEESEALERLTRAEVIELGISDYVCETSDERPERLKQGKPKPLSVAIVRAMERDRAYDEEQKKQPRAR